MFISDTISEKIHKSKTIVFASQGLGSFNVPVSPLVSSKLYWNLCIPYLCYGLEVLDTDQKDIEALDSFHCRMAKQIQGLPEQCSNSGSLGTIGWHSIECHIDYIRLLFLWQLLLLPITCVYKRICIQRLCALLYDNQQVKYCSPICNMFIACKKYCILGVVK